MEKTKAKTKVTYRFPNGSEFTGTIIELRDVAKTLGQPIKGLSITPRGYYNSGSAGLVEIATMHSHHIRRALIKTTRENLGKVFVSSDTNTNFLSKYENFFRHNLIEDLKQELVLRGDDDAPRKSTKFTVKPNTKVAKATPAKAPAKKSTKKVFEKTPARSR